MRTGPSKDWVVLAVAVGLATALNMFTFAVLWDAIFSQGPGLSSNATQILTGWGGGVIGIIGAYVGYRARTFDDEDRDGAAAGDLTTPPHPGAGSTEG